ncbi:hypothetical protein JW998_17635 [candidate division KSB1 bacterium]|nr:hypothetical protein [candidate division KSB1 bacterium]
MKNSMAASMNLADSLLAFSNSSQEIFDYLTEHLYIQTHLASPHSPQRTDSARQNNLQHSCHKLYYAADDASRREAMDEIRKQMTCEASIV